MALTEHETRVLGPILSDGTPVLGLIDVPHKEVSFRLF